MTRTHQLYHPTPLPTLLGGGHRAAAPQPQSLLARLFGALQRWRHHAQMRGELLTLDDRLLQDIGMTRADVDSAVRSPFWRTVAPHDGRDYR